ncbi:MAG: hypothetical protein KKD99_07895, partial [Proteobacteria bacterium]|nr:hypothetical protein [Pseudomonadota bacterium]
MGEVQIPVDKSIEGHALPWHFFQNAGILHLLSFALALCSLGLFDLAPGKLLALLTIGETLDYPIPHFFEALFLYKIRTASAVPILDRLFLMT